MKKPALRVEPEPMFSIEPPDGIGRMIPVGAHIKILLGFLESDNFSRVSVLADVLEDCGIDPEDISRYNRNGEKHMQGDWNNDEKYSWETKK